ncbi:MAG: hypothetical protein LLF97_08285 [Planctomycetaceae bacterium]|nr:hypothetical protein [Planctomycetaceae bacterium]
MAQPYPSKKVLLQIANTAEEWAKTLREKWPLDGASVAENPARLFTPKDLKSNLNMKIAGRQLYEVLRTTAVMRDLLADVAPADPLDGIPKVGRLRKSYPCEIITAQTVCGWSDNVSRAIAVLKKTYKIVLDAALPPKPKKSDVLVGVGDVQGIEWAARVLRETANVSSGKAAISKDEANLRAREALKNTKTTWSERKLAKAIGCSAGLVHKLPAWRAHQEELAMKGKKTAGGPKACGLTDGIMASKGQDDPELERLIAEQQADFEESPLVSNARKHRRRPKV